MLSSETQLDLKRDVIVKAYNVYSSAHLQLAMGSYVLTCGHALADLPECSIPTIEETVESPSVYGYRTKITPHFERPPKRIKPYTIQPGEHPEWLKIGFNMANSNATMDIEVRLWVLTACNKHSTVNDIKECPIATPILNEKYKADRAEIAT